MSRTEVRRTAPVRDSQKKQKRQAIKAYVRATRPAVSWRSITLQGGPHCLPVEALLLHGTTSSTFWTGLTRNASLGKISAR